MSVELAIGVSALVAAGVSRRLARYQHQRASTVHWVRSEGFALLATFEHPISPGAWRQALTSKRCSRSLCPTVHTAPPPDATASLPAVWMVAVTV